MMRRRKPRLCPTGKRSFATEAGARDALLSTRITAELGNSQRRREERYYQCTRCSMWHLTSYPKE